MKVLTLAFLIGLKVCPADFGECYVPHVDWYGNDLATLYPVANLSDCVEACKNTTGCLLFSYREVQRECILMDELMGKDKRNAQKVTSGFLIDPDAFETCTDGHAVSY